jgi:hypothetical protein
MQDTEVAAEAMAEVDISGMDFARLSALREQIEARVREMREMRETEGPALRERVIEEAAAMGMTIEELVPLGGKRRGRPPKEPWERCTGSTRSSSCRSKKISG